MFLVKCINCHAFVTSKEHFCLASAIDCLNPCEFFKISDLNTKHYWALRMTIQGFHAENIIYEAVSSHFDKTYFFHSIFTNSSIQMYMITILSFSIHQSFVVPPMGASRESSSSKFKVVVPPIIIL